MFLLLRHTLFFKLFFFKRFFEKYLFKLSLIILVQNGEQYEAS